MTDLFSPLSLGSITAANRILMAPLTRCRAEGDHVPTALMAEYYAQRASAGLIIAEATMILPGNSAFWHEPGIYSDEQIQGWRLVTDAVHQAGGKIALQIWHGGRACHPDLNEGAIPVAPSALAIRNEEVHTPKGKQAYTLPRALRDDEIPAIVEGFAQAARNAMAAGFDLVEIHGANGYLLDEFLRDGSNLRTGPYGGSVENRSRLLLETLTAVGEAIGIDKTGVRLSPLNSFNDMQDSDPIHMLDWLTTRLNDYGLAFLHLMRSDFYGRQTGDTVSVARQNFRGPLIVNMGYTPEEAKDAVASDQVDAVAFGTAFLANPDLPERIHQQHGLNEPDPATFYTPGAKGYTDYPTMDA
ncbi:alkene reductase [Acidithiobacillus marinus]|uniref:Alkene reductase n=1 Tax=Acidithiobacillus marinus TaxID=187490 RepID=A0A2I1DJJ2_9PROT|nr:alkene reductase [Acidithiobacillus marinus]PKY10047.1 alkene reductase [Acidithiobacillus marinus]